MCPIPGKLGIKIYYICLISEFLCILKEAFTSDTIMCFKRRFVFAHYFFEKKRLLAKCLQINRRDRSVLRDLFKLEGCLFAAKQVKHKIEGLSL